MCGCVCELRMSLLDHLISRPTPHFTPLLAAAHFLWVVDWSIGGGLQTRERMEELLKEYCFEEHTTWLWRLWTNARAGGREETRERKIEKIKTLHLPPGHKKGGILYLPLPPSSKIGFLRKYCYSVGASIGVTYCPLSPLMNGIRSFLNSNG